MKTQKENNQRFNKYPSMQALFGIADGEKATYTGVQKDLMIREGLHLPELHLNRSEFTKSDIEVLTLKTLKKAVKKAILEAGKNPKKVMNAKNNMIICLKV